MRIISQDGCCDIPYEQAVVARLDRTVVAYPLNDLGSSDYIQLADYSTEEKSDQGYVNVQKQVCMVQNEKPQNELAHYGYEFSENR